MMMHVSAIQPKFIIRNDNQTQILRHKYNTMGNFDISTFKQRVIL
ncbi:hypothetical protein MtrunA17_Chr6g0473291 [Medicago truncatula]|uniref:Uncharacterized protein n=1 Tax=Medicago truncatula TaxID=3880 RepID=A0A396HGW1_MEDTR|nr:hypothetical protein MtrunA17_Chr6g0473291 [Medicago truncatula]